MLADLVRADLVRVGLAREGRVRDGTVKDDREADPGTDPEAEVLTGLNPSLSSKRFT